MSKNKKKTKYLIHEIDHRGLPVPAISFPWPDGKRLRRRVGDEEATKDLIAACVYQVHHGDWVAYRRELEERLRKGVSENAKAQGDLSIAELAAIFYNDWCVSRHDAPGFYEKELKNVVRIVGDRRLQTFTRDDGNYFYQTRLTELATTGPNKGQPIATVTANHGMTALSAMLKFAFKEKGWIPTHPTEGLEWKKAKKKKRFPVDGLEIRRFVAEAMKIDDVLGRCFGIVSETAIRYGEAVKVKRLLWDARNEQLILEPSKADPDGRQIPLSPWAIELAAGLPIVVGNPYLFPRKNSRDFLRRSYVIKVFEQARIAAGIPFALRPHDLRHFRAVTWLENGNDIDKVRVWMGHKCIATTQIYLQYVSHRATSAFKDSVKRELEKLNEQREQAQ